MTAISASAMRGGAGRRAGIAGFASAALVACLFALAAAAAPGAMAEDPAWGQDFGFADVTGPDGVAASAFPDPAGKAWWAGTCDVEGGAFAVGADPGVRFAHCIDHSAPSGLAGFPVPGHGPVPPIADGRDAGTSGPRGWGGAPEWRIEPVAQAGAHPDATAAFWMTRHPHVSGGFGNTAPDGDPREVLVRLPAGVVGDPNAVAKCPDGPNLHIVPVVCPPESQVGVATLSLGSNETQVMPVYNVEPRDGKTAEFIMSAGVNTLASNVPIVARARTEGDFGADVYAIQLPAGIPLLGQTVTLWGVPWAAEHDSYRAPQGYRGSEGVAPGMPVTGLAGGSDTLGSQEPQSYDPSWGPIRPFFSNPTECSPSPPVTEIHTVMWQAPHTERSAFAPADAVVEGCDEVPFEPDLELETTTRTADAATGLRADLSVPQADEPPFPAPSKSASEAEVDQYVADATAHWRSPAGRATAHLDRAVVTLPAGVAVNPAGAAGLDGCTDAQMGVTDAASQPMLFDNEDPFDGAAPECPPGSVIGTVAVHTPLLDETLSGQVVLGQPKSTDPASGEMFRLFVVVRNRERGLLAKIFGSAVADPTTGQLTATFDKNPRLPFDRMALRFKGGDRGQLAMPQRCGAGHGWSAAFTPWTAAHGGGGATVADAGAFVASRRCAFGFAPRLSGGMDERQGGGSGTFALRFDRSDGEQWLRSVAVELPKGLLASVRGVPLCTDAQATAGVCPAASRIGVVDAAAGSGTPYFLERKGDVYLTEGYKGAPYGLMTRVPVEAGPFRGRFALEPVVVRQALHIDPTTAQATAVSDPFPEIWHGIPLRVRQVTVKIDRPGFMRNPTDCSAKRIVASFTSTEGARSTAGQPFQATGCARLGFEPKLRLRLVGRRQTRTGRHPAVRALVGQRPGEAGIARAKVRLPKSLALDPANAQALCEFEDGTKPDLENRCPKGSIVGRARAVSPLLNRPLSGPVFFVKNIRIHPDTGNEIRTLPMIVVALRGEIAINLRGESSTTRSGKLVNTFADVPDAPVSRFALRIKGGRSGILVVTRTRRSTIDICKRPQLAIANVDGHNGRRNDQNVRMRTPCRRRPARCRARKPRLINRCKRRARRNANRRAARHAAAARTRIAIARAKAG